MTARRLVFLALVLGLVALVGVYLGIRNLNAAVSSGVIEKAVVDLLEQKLGIRPHQFRIVADYPQISIEEIGIPAVDGELFSLGALRLRFDTAALSRGVLKIDELLIDSPRLFVEKDAEGRLNIRRLISRIRAHRERLAEEAKSDFQKQMDRLLAEAEALADPLREQERAAAEAAAAADPSPDPPAPPPEEPPPPPPAPPRSPPDLGRILDGPVQIGRIRLKDATLRFVDHSVGPEPFRGVVEGLGFTLKVPSPTDIHLRADLAGTFQGAPLEIHARLSRRDLLEGRPRGTVGFRLGGLPLGSVQPYLAKRGVPVDLGRIPLHIDGSAEVDGEDLDYRVGVRIPDSTIRVARGEVELAPTLGLLLEVTPGRIQLEALRIALGDAVALALEAEVTELADPKVEARLRTERFDLPALLPMLPPAVRARLAPLSPRLELALDARVSGYPRRKEITPDVALTLGPGGVDLALGEEPLPIRLAPTTLRFDGETVHLEGLEVQVADLPVLAASLVVEGMKELPRARLDLRIPDLDLEAAVARLPERLPLKTEKARAGVEKVRGLDPTGRLGADVHVQLNTPVLGELPELAGVRDLRGLIARLKEDPGLKDALREKLRDPDTRKALLDQGLADVDAEVRLQEIEATVKKGDLVVPVRLDARAVAGTEKVEVAALAVRALGALLSLQGGLSDPLGEKGLDVALRLGSEAGGPLRVPDVIERLPDAVRKKVARFTPRGEIDLSVAVSGVATAPRIDAGLLVQDLGARIQVPRGGVADVALESLQVRSDGKDLRIPPATLRTPVGTLVLSGEVGDLRGEKDLRIRLRTPGQGLDFLAALPLLPPETREKVAKLDPETARLKLQVDATGNAAAPAVEARAQLDLDAGSLGVEARVSDLKGDKDLAVSLRTLEDGIRIEDVLAKLPPEVRERVRVPLTGRVRLGVQVGGQLADRSSIGITSELALGLPGGDVKVDASVKDPRGSRLLAATVDASFSRLEEILGLLPPEAADRIRALRPAAELKVQVKAGGDRERIRAKVRAGLSHASVEFPRGDDEVLPLRIQPAVLGATVDVVPRPDGLRPLVDVDGGLRLDAVALHPEKGPIDVGLRASSLVYDGKDVRLGGLELRSLDQTIRVTGEVRDVKGAKELDVHLGLDLVVPEVVSRLVPPEAEIRSNGTLAIRAQVEGTAVRPRWQGTIELADFFLDAYKLRGHPVAIQKMKLEVTRDDLVVHPFQVRVGAKDGDWFMAGSMKEIADVENLWKALAEDREAVIDRMKKVLASKGGKKAVVKMVGNETLLRILGSSAHKIIIHIEADDLPGPYTFKTLLSGDESRDFDFRKEEILAKYKELALKEIYGKYGQQRKLFGRHQAQVFPIKSYFALVLDQKFNMVHPKRIPFWRLVTTPTKF